MSDPEAFNIDNIIGMLLEGKFDAIFHANDLLLRR